MILCEMRTPDHEGLHGCCGKWWCEPHYQQHRQGKHMSAQSIQVEEKVQSMTKAILADPIPMLLWCPMCSYKHVDKGEFATKSHHTHACQRCGLVWRPAVVATVGVEYLPGFKDEVGP